MILKIIICFCAILVLFYLIHIRETIRQTNLVAVKKIERSKVKAIRFYLDYDTY